MKALVFAIASCALVACGDSSSGGDPQPGIDATSETIEQDASTESGFQDSTPTTKANGNVGAWQTLAPMPIARANHCAAFGGGFLFVIGGNKSDGAGGFVATNVIHAAKVERDGTIDAWFEAGHTPSAVTECTAVARDNELYVIDGIYATKGEEEKVYHATIDDTGNVSLFDTAGLLPAGKRALSKAAYIDFGTLRVTSDDLDVDAGTGTTGALRAALATVTFLYDGVDPVWRGRPEYAWTGAFLYFIGGYAAGTTTPILSVDGAGLTPDGQLTGQFTTTPLAKATMFGQAIAVDGYVFLVGGRDGAFGGTSRADVLSTPVHADGTLGDWTAQTSMPEARSNFQLTLGGEYVFVTGGGNTGGGLDNAWSARVRF